VGEEHFKTRIEEFVDHNHVHGQLDAIHTHSHTMHTRVRPTLEELYFLQGPTNIQWHEQVPMKGHPTNPGCELVELRLLFTILLLVFRNMFYRGAAIYHLFVSDQTRVCDITRIPCNALQCLPIVAAGPICGNRWGWVITGTAKFAKNHKILSRIKVWWETLMVFLWLELIMSILAECQPFVHHGLGETRAKPPAFGHRWWAE
jgi:hypothetical protein